MNLDTQQFVFTAVPHRDLLTRIEAGLANFQFRLEVLDKRLAELGEKGVWLDASGVPVVPNFSPRNENGRQVGWVLVWPSNYAFEARISRRKYVSKADLESMRAQRERTRKYDELLEERKRLANDLRATGESLKDICRWRGW